MTLNSGRRVALASAAVLTIAVIAGGFHFAIKPSHALGDSEVGHRSQDSLLVHAASALPAGIPSFEMWTPDLGARSYAVGDFTVAITHGETDAVVSVSVPGKTPLTFPRPAKVAFSQVAVDRAVQKPQLLLRLIGVEDCCTDEWLLTHKDGALHPVKLGSDLSSVVLGVHDLDGDGKHELVSREDIFVHGFSEEDSGRTVPVVMQMADGALIDHSTDPAYRAYYEVLAQEARNDCRVSRTYAACAAYAAVSARAGRLRNAMPLVTQAKGSEDERLPYVCNDNRPCIDEDERIGSFDSFTDALNFVLPALGYS